MATSALPALSPAQRAQHLQWLRAITMIPTASGKEQRVIAWIERWLSERPGLEMVRDDAGNMEIRFKSRPQGKRPVYFTAHLDHPAFVVERIVAPGAVQLSFRGGVMDEYFRDAAIIIWDAHDQPHKARLTGAIPASPFTNYSAELEQGTGRTIAVGDVGVWDIGEAHEADGNLYTLACDDLAALAAAVSAYDVLLQLSSTQPLTQDVRLLFTRAEEIGFIGAIAAVRNGIMPKDARVIALENSRAFPESPIGGGPIVRVGDRISVFAPTLTEAIAKRAEEVAGGASTVTASQKLADLPQWKWQRKLMAGGACEASVFFHAGYEATCVCLPLGNYHNMGDLANVQAGTNTAPAKIAPEFISISDYHGLVDLLIACGLSLPERSALGDRFEKLWKERSFVL